MSAHKSAVLVPWVKASEYGKLVAINWKILQEYGIEQLTAGSSSHVSRSGLAGSQLITIHCSSICGPEICRYMSSSCKPSRDCVTYRHSTASTGHLGDGDLSIDIDGSTDIEWQLFAKLAIDVKDDFLAMDAEVDLVPFFIKHLSGERSSFIGRYGLKRHSTRDGPGLCGRRGFAACR